MSTTATADLTGSAKQVEWATSILRQFDNSVAAATSRLSSLPEAEQRDRQATIDRIVANTVDHLPHDAGKVIDGRSVLSQIAEAIVHVAVSGTDAARKMHPRVLGS